jgi:hypothetical protein
MMRRAAGRVERIPLFGAPLPVLLSAAGVTREVGRLVGMWAVFISPLGRLEATKSCRDYRDPTFAALEPALSELDGLGNSS